MGVIKTPFETLIQASTPQEEIKPQEQPKEETKAEAKPKTAKKKEAASERKQATAGRPRLNDDEIRNKRISLVVTQSLYEKIDNASRDKRQTVNSYINDILKTILGE